MKTRNIFSAVLLAASVGVLNAQTITVPAGETMRPTQPITGETLVKDGAGTLDLSGVPLKNKGLFIREGAVRFSAAVKGDPVTVKTRYLRWTITGTRPNAQFSGSGPQFSEFRLFYRGKSVSFPSTTISTSHNHTAAEGADKGFDGNLRTKCYQRSPFILDFGQDVTFDAYSYATANDAIGRDPRDWTLEIGQKLNGRIVWQVMGVERGFEAPQARFTEAGKMFQLAPGGAFPVDYPIEIGGKGRLQLDGIGGLAEFLSGAGLIEISNCSLTFPPDTKFTGSVIGGAVNYQPKRPF